MAPARPTVGVVIVAAGSGQRFGDVTKVLYPLAGKPMLLYSLELFSSIDMVTCIVVVAGRHSFDGMQDLVSRTCPDKGEICLGGKTRRDSVRRGFERVPVDLDLVAVHDAARPLVGRQLVLDLFNSAATSGAAVPVLPVSDTVYRVEGDGRVREVVDRSQLRAAQTPQVARQSWLANALAAHDEFTDEGSALLASGHPVTTVAGCAENIKITFPEDVLLAESMLERRGRR